MTHTVFLALVGFLGGALGSMVGLGGGVFIIPGLTLFLGVPIHGAIGTSLLAVIATSTTATWAYTRDETTNLRLATTMETFTVIGALAGGLVGAALSRGVLSAVFGVVMVVVAVYLAVRPNVGAATVANPGDVGALGTSFRDRNLGVTVSYRVRRLPVGLGASLLAGGVSGLLGVGGGFLQVPVMALTMGIPIRAAVSTSSCMLGVTAAVGAIVYLTRGLVDPVTAMPVVLGVIVGAFLGARLAQRVRSSVLTFLLAFVLFVLAIQMILAAMGISVR